ncbi:amidohydrolase family protein [Bradyrhizobium canariense]|nr:amidohydrolase family protein [Bradyrhizobium canariense]
MLRIDVHHHISPPYYEAALSSEHTAALGLFGKAPLWSVERSLESMNHFSIDCSILSISAPGFWFGDIAKTKALVRKTNEHMASIVSNRPSNFGFFASLPLPDVAASLDELVFAFDTLHADGIGLMSNYSGSYLSQLDCGSILEELNRRGSVVFVHPTSAPYGALPSYLPPPSLEFPFETTRAIVDLLASGILTKYPKIQFIFTHAGGTVPFLTDRISRLSRRPDFRNNVPDGVPATLSRLFYDTALSANPRVFSSLRQLAPSDQILFGTDFPFADDATVNDAIHGLEALGMTPPESTGIFGENALRLFPRLRSAKRPHSASAIILGTRPGL